MLNNQQVQSAHDYAARKISEFGCRLGFREVLEGRLNEIAVAIAIGFPIYDTSQRFSKPDFPLNIEPKSRSLHENKYLETTELWINPGSFSSLSRYVLGIYDKRNSSETRVANRFFIVGWIPGELIIRKGFNPTSTKYGLRYRIPQVELFPIEELLEEIRIERINQNNNRLRKIKNWK